MSDLQAKARAKIDENFETNRVSIMTKLLEEKDRVEKDIERLEGVKDMTELKDFHNKTTGVVGIRGH